MKRLQPFDFKGSRYERPNQNWVCGRKDCGDACPLGPDPKGGCRATAECKPRKEGARWFCTRADARGGKCPDGPQPDGSCCRLIPPCTPRRSVRARRGQTVFLVSALTLGGVLLALGLNNRDRTFNPGPLTAAHASSAANCDHCHTAAQLGAKGWLAGAFASTSAHADSQLCLKCHSFGPQAEQPHSLAPVTLASLTKKVSASAGGAAVASAHPVGGMEGLACGTCHQEHHGSEANLKQIADASCQVCHAVQFAGFGSGHPEFGTYPYTRRTRIEFDHQAHITGYFPAAAKQGQHPPTQCNDCHTTGTDNRLMLVKSFAVTCAACHLDGITKPGTKGIAVLGIPGLDKKSLDAKTPGIGAWPADADGDLTPFMRQLLAQDPKAAAALAVLKGTDLTNLAKASPETLAAASDLAWAVKELFADLITNGHSALQKRLGPTAPATAVGQLPPESVQAFTQTGWWPDLLDEVAAHRAGRPVAPPPAPPPPVAASQPNPPPANAPAKSGGNDLLGGDDLLGTDTPKPAATPAKPAVAGDLLGGDDLLGAPAPAAPASPAVPQAPEPLPPEKWASTGGWHVSSADFTLRYRPSGHGDAFLAAWLELTAAGTTPESRALFNEIAAASTCTKCHSVDTAPSGAMAVLVNWHAAAPEPQVHTFTKFSHGTHFSLLDEKGCQTCHQFKTAAGNTYADAYRDNLDPAKFASSFQPLNQAVCAQCHTEHGAGTSCLLCHNYHVGDVAPAKVNGYFQPPAPKA